MISVSLYMACLIVATARNGIIVLVPDQILQFRFSYKCTDLPTIHKSYVRLATTNIIAAHKRYRVASSINHLHPLHVINRYMSRNTETIPGFVDYPCL